MSKEFSSAVQQLVRAHIDEVNDLKRRIALYDGSKPILQSMNSDFLNTLVCDNRLNQIPSKLHDQEPESPRDSLDGSYDAPGTPRTHPSLPTTPLTTPREVNLNPMTPTLAYQRQMTSYSAQDDESQMYCTDHIITSDRWEKCQEQTRQEASDSESSVNVFEERWASLAALLLSSSNSAHYVVHPGWAVEADGHYSDGAASTFTASTFSTRRTARASHAVFELHRMLQEKKASKLKLNEGAGKVLSATTKIREQIKALRSGNASCVLHPDSPIRRIWIVMCCILFMYEIIAITMAPFGVFQSREGKKLEYCSTVFWSCDILMNFFSGIYTKGVIELRLKTVAKKYARTWLSFDIIVVASQWCALLFKELSDRINALVLLRLVRVFRFFHIGRFLYWLKDEFGLSRSAMSIGKLVNIMIILYFFVHCFACIMYAVGKFDGGWVSQYKHRLQDESLSSAAVHNYMVCLHWTLTQLQGNVDIYPGATSTGSLLFVVISSCCSIVALTLFVSSATDTFQDVRRQQQDQLDQERLLHEFFRRHDICPEIKHRADYYLDLKKRHQIYLESQTNDDLALMMFSKEIKSQLLAEIRADSILWHPLFSYLNRQVKLVFVRICADAMHSRTYEPNDDVFTAGELSSEAFFIVKGEFQLNAKVDLSMMFDYLQNSCPPKSKNYLKSSSSLSLPQSISRSQRRTSEQMGQMVSAASVSSGRASTLSNMSSLDVSSRLMGFSRPVREVMDGHLVSEISLWMPWVHAGDLCSTRHGHSLTMNTRELISTVKLHLSQFGIFACYAQRFVIAAKCLNETLIDVELMGFQQVLEIEEKNGLSTCI